MATRITMSQNAEKKAMEVLETAKKSILDNDLDAYAKAVTELDKAVSDWNDCIQALAYEELLKEEHPIIAAVKRFYVDAYRIKTTAEKETGRIKEIALEKRSRRIDLEKFCDFGNLDKSWTRSTTELRNLLEARETDIYAMKPADLAKKSYYFMSIIREKEAGKTPDSKTQIVKQLQKVVDEAIFVDNGEGKNVYKCNNHDIAFIQDAVTKFDAKKKCSIAMLNDRAFQTVMMSVFAHCLGETITVTPGAKKTKQ